MARASDEPALLISEPVQACVIARELDLTDDIRAKYAQCLGWQAAPNASVCQGFYQTITVAPLASPDEVRIMADKVSFYRDKPSTLTGHVEIQQTQRIVNAQTAYIYRDVKTNQVNRIEFLGEVRYLEPGRMMIAKKAVVNPQDKSGEISDVVYRFNTERSGAVLPAWGRASLIRRYANKDYLLQKATYTTCAPQDKAWDVEAKSIAIDDAKATGVAKNAVIRIRQWPVFYTPYLSFPTNKERKSGFLLPLVGYSNVGGLDLGLPYYWNIAPNYDMTLTPHLYSERGLMMGGEFRYLTSNSFGILSGNFLPHDKAYKNFLLDNELSYPRLANQSDNRWSLGVIEQTRLTPNLKFNLNAQQVSDDYYLQDFSSNLAQITQRQLLRQADLTYTTDHWLFRGMVQSYQTLHPVNEPPVSSVYERLPQLSARGLYYNLPFNANVNFLGQYDEFHWPTQSWEVRARQQGPRLNLNPNLSLPYLKPWGFVTPSVQLVETYYSVNNPGDIPNHDYNRAIPRYSLDSGLYFERDLSINSQAYSQTLEPRLFYLNVPYQDQSQLPIYDSGYMIFNASQLFRTNRFSGFDRIGDANQLTYALTSRWLSEATGAEKANITVGQIRYFADRKVQLCQSNKGYCLANPNMIGYLSPTFDYSPVASRATYHFNSAWSLTGDYVWDPATRATNNTDVDFHYHPLPNAAVSAGYSYLINADRTRVNNAGNSNALHQALLAYAWPLNEKWSTIGAYSQNISKNYSMMSLLGVQYDSCCWAMRLMGGRTFKSLSANFEPQYNNNIYLQLLLKGLGSVATSDPHNILSTYIPGYTDPFQR
ncbi:LPS-assembly protein LptD [Legionella sp. km772]|uniref:LPS-assembly protein LptD n=1 Tax=Legionella sp. km772 TaxID=2498111 RepID=UPI0018F72030|nr:LPS-assembly protein LptD [Legionella sp. km772]